MTKQLPLFDGMGEIRRTAKFSECRTWRYTLERVWDAALPRLLFVLLNPSTADEVHDDPTNRRGIRFARDWGYGACIFVNLFAVRTPLPSVMKEARDPVGPGNNWHIHGQAIVAGKIVVAWGAHGTYLGRDAQVLALLEDFDLYCLGRTKAGHPKHPLYLPASTQPEPYGAHSKGDNHADS